jgi:hypothetical protein
MIKEALKEWDRKLKAVSIIVTFSPTIERAKQCQLDTSTQEDRFVIDRSGKEVATQLARAAFESLNGIDSAIAKLYDAQREYNKSAGIYELLDSMNSATRNFTTLAKASTTFSAGSERVNNNTVKMMNISAVGTNFQVTLHDELAIDFNPELEKLRAKIEKLKNKIGIANTKMFEIQVDPSLFSSENDE